MNDTKSSTIAVVAVAVGLVAVFGPACGQETGKVMIEVAACIKLAAAEARLACYDSRVAELLPGAPAARAPANAAVAPAPVVTAPLQSRGDGQGRREERAARPEEAAAANEIVSRVKELRETVPNAYLITLENGQVWRQMQPKQYPLRPGLQVRIYGTRWGSASRLSADEINGYIQVERAR